MRRYLPFAVAASLCLFAACSAPPSGGDDVGTDEEALVVCPGASTVKGIDVSSWQGDINWTKVKNSGVVFAIARVSDGTYLDPKFSQNWSAMKSVGMIRGAYQFFRPSENPTTLANIMIQKMGTLKAGDLPPTLDVEVTDGQSAATIASKIQTWVTKIKSATGRTPIIYTGYYFWKDNVGSSAFSSLPLWIANYGVNCPSVPPPWTKFKMWQYSSTGSVPGIGGNVDMDKFNGTKTQLLAWAQPPNAKPKGYLDAADCTSIRGWAQDPDKPATSISVQLDFNAAAGQANAIQVTTKADVHRDDLCQPLGSCNHGFSFTTPRGLKDGKSHPVHAYGLDATNGPKAELTHSPKSFTCAPPAPPLDADHGVKRWIPSQTVMSNWKFSTLYDLAHEPDSVVNAYPQGEDLPNKPDVEQADDGTPEVWVIDHGYRRHVINPASLKAWRFTTIVKKTAAAQVYSHPIGPDFRPSPFLIKGSTAPIYVIDVPFPPPPNEGGGGGGAMGTGGGGAMGTGGSGAGGSDATGEGGGGTGGDSATGAGGANAGEGGGAPLGDGGGSASDSGDGGAGGGDDLASNGDTGESGGCSAAPAGGASRGASAAIALLAVGLVAARRRRRSA